LNFLEANRILKNFDAIDTDKILFATSGTSDQMSLFLRAQYAQDNIDLEISTLPFGTLSQFLIASPPSDDNELFLLMPWDLVPETDWRTGFPENSVHIDELLSNSEQTVQLFKKRRNARFFYLPAPILPIFSNSRKNQQFSNSIANLAHSLGAIFLESHYFSLASYLSNGCPIGGSSFGQLSNMLYDALTNAAAGQGKILVTDLDNVMWNGVIAEDGLDGIHMQPEGKGYKHFLYQSCLLKLKSIGVLLACVSRNDPATVKAIFQEQKLLLREDDFVAIIASYNAKSSQIKNLADHLNLGLSAFVFVDDNPLEIEEVKSALPEVETLLFPASDDDLATLFHRLDFHFGRNHISAEDLERTTLYRNRLKSVPPSEQTGADLEDFLKKLKMKLIISDRTYGDNARAVQLLNKTNQFNLNGRRFEEEEVFEILAQGGKLLTGRLSDRVGNHGEIMACLISQNFEVVAWVMSCRVFQRRVEHAFLSWISKKFPNVSRFEYKITERNVPFQNFIRQGAFFKLGNDQLTFDASVFAAKNSHSTNLFDRISDDLD
jgi:FkbH-like protein